VPEKPLNMIHILEVSVRSPLHLVASKRQQLYLQAEPMAAFSVPDHEIAAPLPVECGHL
jgi:hypothetical protein